MRLRLPSWAVAGSGILQGFAQAQAGDGGVQRTDLLAGDQVLPDQAAAVLKLRLQVQIGIHHCTHRTLHIDQSGEEEKNGLQVAMVIQVAAGQNQIADAGSGEFEPFRHGGEEVAQVVADQFAHGVENGIDQGVLAVHHASQPLAQGSVALPGGQAIGKQLKHFRVAQHTFVSQGHQTAAQIPHRRHVEGVADDRRAASGIERGHQVSGVVGVVFQGARQLGQRRSAAEEQYPGPQFGNLAIATDDERVGNIQAAGEAHSGHHRGPAASIENQQSTDKSPLCTIG